MSKFVILRILIISILLCPVMLFAQTRSLRLVCDEWPPYQMKEKKGVKGFSVELVTMVLDRMSVQVDSLRVYPWKRAIVMLERGQADALFSANHKESRTVFAHYPGEALVLSPWVLWGNENMAEPFGSYHDLKNKRMGLVAGYSYTQEFWKFVKAHGRYSEVISDEQNFKKLDAGRVDYVLAELGNGLYLVKKLGLKHIIPFPKQPVKIDGLYVIFSKKNVSKAFVSQFSRELWMLKQEPAYQKLYDLYFNPTHQK